ARAARAIARRWSEPTRFLVPLASGLDEAQAVQALAAAGWEPAPAAEASPGGVWLAPREGGSARLWLASGRFRPMVRACRLGLGKPVVAFPGPGFQATLTFLRDQQRLLGEAVALTEPDPEAVAREVCQILTDPHRYRRMAEAGRAVMGQPGAAGRMARQILAALTGGEGPFRAVEEAPGGPEGGARTGEPW